MTSRWPLVTGSKDPGQTQRRTVTLSSRARCRHEARRDRTKASPRRSGGTAARRSPSGQAQVPPRVARSTTTSARRREPAVARARRAAPSRSVVVGDLVRRVEEHDVVRRRAGRAGRRRRAARPGPADLGTGQPDGLDVGPQDPDRRRRRTRRAGRAAAPRLSASSPTAPEPAYRSSDPAAGERPEQRLQRGEQPLAGPVGGRPGASAGRHGEPAPPRRPRDPGTASLDRTVDGRCHRAMVTRLPDRAAELSRGDGCRHGRRLRRVRVRPCRGSRRAARRAAVHRVAQAGVPAQLGVAADQRGGVARGPSTMTSSSREHAQQPQARPAPGLRGAEHVALAALLEVEAGQLEAVEGGGDGVQPLAGRRCRPRRR